MRWIGITGRSGSGKSCVTAWFAAQGYPCADADELARRLLTPGSADAEALLAQLQKRFGYDIVDDAGVLNRQRLADRAFATPQATRALNAVTHPALLRLVKAQAREAERAGESLFFLDGAAIVGTIFAAECDRLVLVTAPYKQSVRRICARDGLTLDEARSRLGAQLPESALRAAADYVLENNGTLAQLQSKAAALLETLRRLP